MAMHAQVQVRLASAVYEPGQDVAGEAVILVAGRLLAERLSLRFRGGVFIATSEDSRGEKLPAEEKIFVDSTVDVWKANEPEELLAGEHRFPLTFFLPESGIASTFSALRCLARVRYSIEATLECGSRVEAFSETEVPVSCPHLVSKQAIPVGQKYTKEFPLHKGAIHLEVRMAKLVYTPIEPLGLSISIYNGWKQSLKYVHVNLVQKVVYQVSLPLRKKTCVQFIDSTGVGLPPGTSKVPSGERLSFSPHLFVPALVPNFSLEGVLSVEHYLRVRVGRCHPVALAELYVPISVVTGYLSGPLIERRSSLATPQEMLIDLSISSSGSPAHSVQLIDLLA